MSSLTLPSTISFSLPPPPLSLSLFLASLAAFIVSDSEEIEEERESGDENEKESVPLSPRILPKAIVNTPQTTTSPGCCTPCMCVFSVGYNTNSVNILYWDIFIPEISF